MSLIQSRYYRCLTENKQIWCLNWKLDIFFYVRWRNEYLTSLRERQNLKYKKIEPEVKVGEVVVKKGNEQNKAQRKLRIITKVYAGRDGKARAVKLRAEKLYLKRAIQHLYLLELSCDITARTQKDTKNGEAEEFRPRKNASEIVRIRIKIWQMVIEKANE